MVKSRSKQVATGALLVAISTVQIGLSAERKIRTDIDTQLSTERTRIILPPISGHFERVNGGGQKDHVHGKIHFCQFP